MTPQTLPSITEESASSVLSEIETRFFDIPFENSDFQTEAFVVSSQLTPQRAYRAIGLRLHAKLQALRELQLARELDDVTLDELQAKIDDPTTSVFDVRRAQIEIKRILSSRTWTAKLTNDALHEVNLLYARLQTFPSFTRAEFESAEQQYFTTKLTRQIEGIHGAVEGLVNMSTDMPALISSTPVAAPLPPAK